MSQSFTAHSGSVALIIGASSGIAKAIIAALIQQDAATATDIKHIISISQSAITPPITTSETKLANDSDKAIIHQHISCDYSAGAIATLCQQLQPLKGQITRVFICNGRLHNQHQMSDTATTITPEKRLEDVDPEAMQALFESNTITPMLWLQHLVKLVAGKQGCIINLLSARVGSISDNRLGGWYSYRASKAALNMLIKTAAIEYARRANNVKLIAFHPGTTDTPLSKPFQANVAEGKLFTPAFVAAQLLQINNAIVLADTATNPVESPEMTAPISFDGQASFIDWQGKQISW
ncbi:SDR family NAD(P)-dependent oxidoreductase [Shewanella sp. UCD-KL21]|uniref:SDR family NAD(P)-dependent oxidoreductase n=1 Tax=Shewanella sp. UCD-KL21 TaxID=1917164 RepID=UPI000970CB8A|nr:SDR family NAD(P)-dependent oxidoreductase [Shewanella sp. UCD-KL21]